MLKYRIQIILFGLNLCEQEVFMCCVCRIIIQVGWRCCVRRLHYFVCPEGSIGSWSQNTLNMAADVIVNGRGLCNGMERGAKV